MHRKTNQLVTWLLPVKNGLPYLPHTLASIAAQTFDRHSVIAWDNGSTDDTLRVLREWIPSRIPGRIIADQPMGLGASLAAMVKLADTVFCARIDADDVNFPQRLEQQVRFLTANPQIAVVGAQAQWIDEQGRLIPGAPTLPVGDAELRWRLRFCNAMHHPTVLFRRDAILEAGNYRDIMPIEDYDLWLRVANRHEIDNLPQPLLRYRVHTNSVSAEHQARIDAIRCAVIKQYADNLFPGLDESALDRIFDRVTNYEHLDVLWRDCQNFRLSATQSALRLGKMSDYFRKTNLYRIQARSLRLRWLKQKPIIAALSSWRKEAA